MIQGIDLKTLSHAEKDELILSLAGQLEAALSRIGELEKRLARLERPAKTPDNSSLPPSQGQKPARATGDKPPRKSRPGFGRTLHPMALLSKFGPVVLMDFGPPPVPQPTVTRVYREAWRGLESQSGFVRAAASGA